MFEMKTKINKGLLTLLVKPVLNIYDIGFMERDEAYRLLSQWFGENLKIITTIAIFVWLTLKKLFINVEENGHILT